MSDVIAHPAAIATAEDVKRLEIATGRVAVWVRDRGPVLRLLSRDELVELVEDMGLDPAGFGPEDAA